MLTWEEIEHGYKPMRSDRIVAKLSVITSIAAIPSIFAVWVLIASKAHFTREEILWSGLLALAVIPLFALLPFYTSVWHPLRRASKCPDCKAAIVGYRADLLAITGRCGGCGVKLTVEGVPTLMQKSHTLDEDKLIQPGRLPTQTMSRFAALPVLIPFALVLFSFAVSLYGGPFLESLCKIGALGMIPGILVTIGLLFLHERRCGPSPTCPHCNLAFRPWASNYAMLTGHCGRCGGKVVNVPCGLDFHPKAIKREYLVESCRKIRTISRQFTWEFLATLWVGAVTTFYVLMNYGNEYAALSMRVFATLLAVLMAWYWCRERTIRRAPDVRCPNCSKSLLANLKVWDPIIATGKCWHCGVVVLRDG